MACNNVHIAITKDEEQSLQDLSYRLCVLKNLANEARYKLKKQENETSNDERDGTALHIRECLRSMHEGLKSWTSSHSWVNKPREFSDLYLRTIQSLSRNVGPRYDPIVVTSTIKNKFCNDHEARDGKHYRKYGLEDTDKFPPVMLGYIFEALDSLISMEKVLEKAPAKRLTDYLKPSFFKLNKRLIKGELKNLINPYRGLLEAPLRSTLNLVRKNIDLTIKLLQNIFENLSDANRLAIDDLKSRIVQCIKREQSAKTTGCMYRRTRFVNIDDSILEKVGLQ